MLKPQRIADDSPREIAQIDPTLRVIFRRLILGELPWPLFLTGPPGRGKSSAALCLADYVRGSVYYRFTRLLKAFQWAHTTGTSVSKVNVHQWRPVSTSADETKFIHSAEPMSEQEFWNYLIKAPLVVIDDIATRGGYTEPQYDQIYDLIEERKLKPMVLVSNLSLVQLGEVFDDRIVSRIARGTIFTLQGTDQRLKRTGPVFKNEFDQTVQ